MIPVWIMILSIIIGSVAFAINHSPKIEDEWISHFWPAASGWYDVNLKCGIELYARWDGEKWYDQASFEIPEEEIDSWLNVREVD